MALSKLHVRYIQSQENFYLQANADEKSLKLPISQLYVKDTNNFYLVLMQESSFKQDTLSISFKEKTPALNTLECQFTLTELSNTSEDYEDALLFFNVDEQRVKQVLLLSLDSLKDS